MGEELKEFLPSQTEFVAGKEIVGTVPRGESAGDSRALGGVSVSTSGHL
jgi:hypothetical protein